MFFVYRAGQDSLHVHVQVRGLSQRGGDAGAAPRRAQTARQAARPAAAPAAGHHAQVTTYSY